jgi:hypothetical protein
MGRVGFWSEGGRGEERSRGRSAYTHFESLYPPYYSTYHSIGSHSVIHVPDPIVVPPRPAQNHRLDFLLQVQPLKPRLLHHRRTGRTSFIHSPLNTILRFPFLARLLLLRLQFLPRPHVDFSYRKPCSFPPPPSSPSQDAYPTSFLCRLTHFYLCRMLKTLHTHVRMCRYSRWHQGRVSTKKAEQEVWLAPNFTWHNTRASRDR